MSHYERWKISGSTYCTSEGVLMRRKRVAGVRRYNKVTVRTTRSSWTVLSRAADKAKVPANRGVCRGLAQPAQQIPCSGSLMPEGVETQLSKWLNR